MNTSFFTKKTIFGIIALLILLAGLGGGVYLSQTQTQLKSQAAEGCVNSAGDQDWGDPNNKSHWCSCAESAGDTGSLINNNCPQVQCENLKTNSICGGTVSTYDQCSPICTNEQRIYDCRSSKNPNCTGQIACASENNQCRSASPPACRTTTVCGQSVTGNSPADCTTSCVNGITRYDCTQSDNSSCVGAIFCGSETCGSGGVCTPGVWSASQCAVCKSDGSGYESTKDYGPNKNSAEWCSCAQRNSGDYATSPTYATCRGGAGTTGNDQAECLSPQPNFLDAKTLNPVQGSLIENTEYILKITMKNTNNSGTTPNPTTWKAGTYSLVPSQQTRTTWLAQPVVLDRDIAPGQEKPFEIKVKTLALTDGNARNVGFYFQMANNGVGFGGACEPQTIKIDPKPADAAPPPPPGPEEKTACFVMSESLTDVSAVTTCDNADGIAKGIIKTYTGDPTTVPYSFQDDIVGIKTVYVRFISTIGNIKDINKQIKFSPDPVLDVIACTHSATGQGTLVGIRGKNFGSHLQQGAGYVKVSGKNATITSWDSTRDVIIAAVTDKLEGEQTVDLKLDDGRVVQGRCNIGISTVQFTVNTQCTVPGAFNAQDVEVRVQEATSGAKPLISKKIRINKGQPVDFAPNIETGKKYSLILKAPETLSKKVDFVADEGTKNLGEIKLWIGDIAPRVAPDGKINTLDKSEMSKQWSLLETKTARTADLNEDSAVNSHDYSCQKLGFNQQDEVVISGTSRNN